MEVLVEVLVLVLVLGACIWGPMRASTYRPLLCVLTAWFYAHSLVILAY